MMCQKTTAGETVETMKNIVSRKNGKEHGYGLKNIHKSVEKYNGHMDISYEGNIFSVGILLYVDDVQINTPST